MLDRKHFSTREKIGTLFSWKLDDLGVVVLAALLVVYKAICQLVCLTETLFLQGLYKYMVIWKIILMIERTIWNFDKYKIFFEKFYFVLGVKIQEIFLTLKKSFLSCLISHY